MKRYRIWLCLMMKRMLKKPAFILLLFILPVLSYGMFRAAQKETTGTGVGIMIDGEQDGDTRNEQLSEWLSRQGAQEGIFVFHVYEEQAAMLRDIERGELECGVVLPGDLVERLRNGTWQGSVMLYDASSSGMIGIIKEQIASMIFSLYSELNYVNYIENTEVFMQAEENGAAREEIVSFAQEAYETHLTDGSTFVFAYHGDLADPEDHIAYGGSADGEKQAGSEDDYMSQTMKKGGTDPGFRLRGILAVCIFLSGLCGLLTDWRDRAKRRFVRIAPDWATTAVNVWIPTVYMSFAALLCLLVTGQSVGAGAVTEQAEWSLYFAGIGKEICHLLFYQFLIVVYCSIIRLLLRKQETMAAAVPILTFASVVCCPVWIRLAVYMPLFRVLEKLFPVTYYLLL